MINRNGMRVLVLSAAGLIAVTGMAQQPMPAGPQSMPNNPNTPNNPSMPGNSANDRLGDATTADAGERRQQDMMFVHDAAEGGMMEVQLGQLAAQKATNPDIKSFGQKMVDDHTALNDSMKPIADKLGVKVPQHLNKKDQAAYDKMSALSGADFDKAYIEDMVKDHHKNLRDFTSEAEATADPDLKAAVAHGRTVIQEHSEMIDKIAKDNGLATSKSH